MGKQIQRARLNLKTNRRVSLESQQFARLNWPHADWPNVINIPTIVQTEMQVYIYTLEITRKQ